MNIYMVQRMVLKGGSPAIHCLGNIGRKEDDFIDVKSENEDYYIGNFSEGFGFIDVKFKKNDCRKLTSEEIEKGNGKWFTINGHAYGQIHLDADGYYAR